MTLERQRWDERRRAAFLLPSLEAASLLSALNCRSTAAPSTSSRLQTHRDEVTDLLNGRKCLAAIISAFAAHGGA